MTLDKYKDILYSPHHVSRTHPPMDRISRAAHFSPFAALVGFEDMIDETNRRTEEFFGENEDSLSILNEKIKKIRRACKVL